METSNLVNSTQYCRKIAIQVLGLPKLLFMARIVTHLQGDGCFFKSAPPSRQMRSGFCKKEKRVELKLNISFHFRKISVCHAV